MSRPRSAFVAGLVGALVAVGVTPAAAQDVYYRSCAEVRAAGKAPLFAGEPGYRSGLDRDDDGVACDTDAAGNPITPTVATSTAPTTTEPVVAGTTAATATTATTASAPVTTATTATTTATTAPVTATTPGTTAPATTTAAPVAGEFGAGVYQVGRDLQAGLYRTAGPTDGVGCGWYRLRANDGEFSSVVAVDVVTGPASVTVSSTDAFVKFVGSCRWLRDGDGSSTTTGPPSTSGDDPGAGGSGDSGGGARSGSTPGAYTQVGGAVPVGGVATGA